MGDKEKGEKPEIGSRQTTLQDGKDNNGPLSSPAHTLDSDTCVKAFETDIVMGLSQSKVKELQAQHGPNQLKETPPPSLLKILVRNTLNAMTIVLIAAMAVSFGTQDFISGGVIFALVVINVGVSTVNEWSAEKTVAALQSVGSPSAVVIRHGDGSSGQTGQTDSVKTEEVVPGDIIIVKIGDIVPADARILDGHMSGLEVDEALLTGESLPSVKTLEPIEDGDCPVGDRTNMVYSGSQVVKGQARCVVVATAMKTELGKIADAMDRKETVKAKGWAYRLYRIKCIMGLANTTPLQVKLNGLAYVLLGISCLLALVVVASTAFENVPLSIATYAVATAVSLLPASLIAVVALSLANASKELANRNALVRKSDAIETLAAVTDVCSDKTGTITVGKMVLKKAWVPFTSDGEKESPSADKGQLYSVESGSDPYYPRAAVLAVDDLQTEVTSGMLEDDDLDKENLVDMHNMDPRLRELVLCGSLCNTSTIQRSEKEDSAGKWEANGDATEVALTTFAYKLGHGRPHLTKAPAQLKRTETSASTRNQRPPIAGQSGHYEKLVEHPFDSSIKRMTVAYKFIPSGGESEGSHVLVLMKGAIERVFDLCDKLGMGKEDATALTSEHRSSINQQYEDLAGEGLRVLTLCGRKVSSKEADSIASLSREELETSDFGFLGLVGIFDPPRMESKAAVNDCKKASIIPRMLTGDHKATAIAIAQAVGIIGKSYGPSDVMTGPEFDRLSEDEIDDLPTLPRVIARCAPETKVRMVEALHRRNRLAVMTGDGVNDAPALKRADVGVAMGSGSDVAKQSGEIVLTDDQFDTIIRAIRKGRSVFSNLSNFLLYLLSGNLGEVLVLMIGLSFQDPTGESTFPLSPVAALWINTLAAGPPALALGLEPTDKNAMNNAPADYKSIFVRSWWIDLFFYGILMAGIALANFCIVLYGYHDGQIGIDCNTDYSDACDVIFQARGTCFSAFLIVLMVHALTCKKPNRSLFKTNLLDNKLLLWCVLALSLSVFPVVYIPVINRDVFLLTGLTWEWGMIFASILVYIAFAELYKLVRQSLVAKSNAKRDQNSKEEFSKEMNLNETMAPA